MGEGGGGGEGVVVVFNPYTVTNKVRFSVCAAIANI